MVPGQTQNPAPVTGPFILGLQFGYWLYGILCLQVLFYYNSFPDDGRPFKIYVWIVFMLETTFIILSTMLSWDVFGSGWGDPAILTELPWEGACLPLLTGMVTLAVHGFYCWRIYRLMANLLVPFLIVLFSVSQFAMTIGILVEFVLARYQIEEGSSRSRVFVTAWMSTTVTSDILVTATMAFLLHKVQRRTSYKSTVATLHKLIVLIIQTGAVTTFASILCCILFWVCIDTNWYYLVLLSATKLYSNTMLATLNARAIFGTKSSKWQRDISFADAFWNDYWDVPTQRQERTSIQIDPVVFARRPDSPIMIFKETTVVSEVSEMKIVSALEERSQHERDQESPEKPQVLEVES